MSLLMLENWCFKSKNLLKSEISFYPNKSKHYYLWRFESFIGLYKDQMCLGTLCRHSGNILLQFPSLEKPCLIEWMCLDANDMIITVLMVWYLTCEVTLWPGLPCDTKNVRYRMFTQFTHRGRNMIKSLSLIISRKYEWKKLLSKAFCKKYLKS